jgi:hypothetical protein
VRIGQIATLYLLAHYMMAGEGKGEQQNRPEATQGTGTGAQQRNRGQHEPAGPGHEATRRHTRHITAPAAHQAHPGDTKPHEATCRNTAGRQERRAPRWIRTICLRGNWR